METVKNGKEKQSAYRNEFSRLDKALKNEFFLEAIAIGYAVIEDRLVSFLHHAGIVSRTKENLLINRAVYPYLRCLLKRDEKYAIRIKDISVKVSLVCRLLTMNEEEAKAIDDSVRVALAGKMKKIAAHGYMLDLYKQINRTIDSELVVDIFYDLEPWRTERNQLIHALLNKTVSSSYIAKKKCAETSISLARGLDNCLVKPFKEGNNLRKKYHIQ